MNIDNNFLFYQNAKYNYVATLINKNKKKSQYDFCSTSGIILKNWYIEMFNSMLNELFFLNPKMKIMYDLIFMK